VGSLFFIFAIFIFHTLVGSTNFLIILTLTDISFELELFLFFCLSLGFAVKVPIFPLHTWLPEAHVQAPTEGSVILASLLLKLGGYGFIRLVLPICFKAVFFFSPVIVGFSICGILFGSMSAVVQLDLKKLIAYSSVAHMNLVVLGLFSLNLQGIQGAIFLMLAHGIVSSGLFFLIGFLYDRHQTRIITYYSGLAQRMPNFSTFLFIFILANVSFPGTSNFVGEILIFAGLIQKSFIITFFAGFGIILSAVYSFFALNRIIYLTPTPHIEATSDLTRLEFNTLVYFTLLIFILGVFPGIILDLTRLSVQVLFQTLY
jgi:proton-translocating NADH-quinone oxidoreductase chain M